MLSLSIYLFFDLSTKSFSDCKYLSTIACDSDGKFPVEKSTPAQFLQNKAWFILQLQLMGAVAHSVVARA